MLLISGANAQSYDWKQGDFARPLIEAAIAVGDDTELAVRVAENWSFWLKRQAGIWVHRSRASCSTYRAALEADFKLYMDVVLARSITEAEKSERYDDALEAMNRGNVQCEAGYLAENWELVSSSLERALDRQSQD